MTANLWADGAVMLGKLNCDEFAMGSANETSAFGPVASPWRVQGDDTDYVPGGSSGLSGGGGGTFCVIATGTDTGGSIRQPAAFGCVGIKPPMAAVRGGHCGFCSSLDQAGPIARNVEDAALMLQSMAGHDPWDSTPSLRRCLICLPVWKLASRG